MSDSAGRTSHGRPQVTVVMSVHNTTTNGIVRGIETTLNQSYTEFEFILVDDGCNSESRAVLQRYVGHDSRIKLLTNERHRKLASSLNWGVRQANGRYIARADANIDYQTDRIACQLEFLEAHPDVDVLGSNFYWATEGRTEMRMILLPEKHPEIARTLSKRACICHPSVMFRRDKLLEFGPYVEGFGKGEDYNLWMRCRATVHFHNLQDPLLTKWHRPSPDGWRVHVDFAFNEILTRIEGLRTSPNVIWDLLFLPHPIRSLARIALRF